MTGAAEMNPRDVIAEINRLRPNYQSGSMLDAGRRQMLDHLEQFATYRIVGPADMEAVDLDSRMKAAGMIPLSDLLAGNTPLEKWMAHTGVRDLDTFEAWLTRKHREFMTMRVEYELGDKDQSDELYEWVFAHAAAFGEAAANFRAMKERSASPHMPVPAGWVLVPEAALKWLDGTGPDKNGHWFGDAPDDNGRGALWWRTKFTAMLSATPKPAALTQEPKPAEGEK